MNVAQRRCCTCRYWYPFAAFDKSRRTADGGYQPQCKECRDQWETLPRGILCRLRERLEKEEPGSVVLWTENAFNQKWEQCGGICTYCKNGLRDYQASGLTLDRLDSKDPQHRPDNTVLCCWPCNRTKGDMEYHAWRPVIEGILSRYPSGVVQWGAENSRWKRKKRRVTWHLRAEAPQVALPGVA